MIAICQPEIMNGDRMKQTRSLCRYFYSFIKTCLREQIKQPSFVQISNPYAVTLSEFAQIKRVLFALVLKTERAYRCSLVLVWIIIRSTFIQFESLKLLRSTFPNYTKLADPRFLRLLNCERVGRAGHTAVW